MSITIKIIDLNSPHLDAVKELGRRFRATLGFMPEGAFDEHASKRSLLGAISKTGSCVGYVLYRRTADCIKIAHLCVATEWRRHKVASKLVDEVSRLEPMYRGIGLRCRRDFDANKVWPRLGFSARGERAGRSYDGKPLIYWWKDHNQPNLFAEADESERALAVIDANVFFDLVSPREHSHAESKALLADWLSDSLTLCVTEELYNEINRNEQGQVEREGIRKKAERFAPCPGAPWEKIERLIESLTASIPSSGKTSDQSDVRQLARAIAGAVPFFITRDGKLLKAADEIYRLHNVTVIRPSDLVVHFDELRQEAQYQPRRLSGTVLRTSRVEAGKDELLAGRLLNHRRHESQTGFLKELRSFLAQPEMAECEAIGDPDGLPLALVVSKREPSGELSIPFLRVAAGPLANTLARHLLFRCVKKAFQSQCHAVRITDQLLDEVVKQAVRMDPFFAEGGNWIRLNLHRLGPAEGLLKQLDQLIRKHGYDSEALKTALSRLSPDLLIKDPRQAAEFERVFWPAKVADAQLPTYVVPIQPRWAQHLFDEKLAAQDLFGARMDLALNRESAYYRAARPAVLKAPARILWYVSKKGRFGGMGELTACSRLEDVVIDTPQVLFKRFRRLGIYEWTHVFETAKGDVDRKIMALRFCDSELLSQRVPHKKLISVLRGFGVRTQLQSPVLIPPEAFVTLYGSSST